MLSSRDLTTIDQKCGGRLVEKVEGASLAIAMETALPPRPADTNWHAARIVEFETPALPLGRGNAIREEFETSCFDVFAVIGDKYDPPKKAPSGLMLCMRPLARRTGLKVPVAIEIKLVPVEKHGGSKTEQIVRIDIVPPTNPKELRLVVLSLARNAQGTTDVTARSVFDGGREKPCTIDPSTPLPAAFSAVMNLETLSLTDLRVFLNSGEITDEYWMDVSLLTAPNSAPDKLPFSFDWLFTGPSNDFAQAVSSQRLLRVPEAEARIVSMSPPIPIVAS